MPTAIKIWEISGEQLKPVEDSNLSVAHVESELETWICRNAELLGDRLLIIDRQRDIPGVGRLDLLGIDEAGRLVIVELKRDRTPREAVAQALDYASWLDSVNEDEIEAHAEQHLQRPLSEAFFEFFQTELPEYTCQNHRIVLAAPRLDESAERIINYLAERHGIEINAVFFRYCKLTDGKELLARSVLVAEDTRPPGHKRKPPAFEQLLAIATDKHTTAILEICRQMRQHWRETNRWTYGGSLRYWAPTPSGQERMIFGVNIAGKNNPPAGQLDIWIPTKSLAEATGAPEADIRQKLGDTSLVFEQQNVDCWIRLKKLEDAQRLVGLLENWVQNLAGAAPAARRIS
ncbi:MAG: endonuclease NucS domain-containing protein [Acidobacteriota bacterium]